MYILMVCPLRHGRGCVACSESTSSPMHGHWFGVDARCVVELMSVANELPRKPNIEVAP